MTVDRIRELCHAEPFRSFILHLPDGRRVVVEHPDFVAFAPSGRILSVFQRDDSQSLVDVMLVSDITVRTNGRKSKGR